MSSISRRIVIRTETGTTGTEGIYFFVVSPETTNNQLDDMSYKCAVENADSYGIYPRAEDFTDSEHEDDCYSDDIYGWYEDYCPEKHDKLVPEGRPPEFIEI